MPSRGEGGDRPGGEVALDGVEAPHPAHLRNFTYWDTVLDWMRNGTSHDAQDAAPFETYGP